jgi:hypothetical protein
VKKKRVIFTTDFDIVLGGIYYYDSNLRVDYDDILCYICLWVFFDICNGCYVKKK